MAPKHLEPAKGALAGMKADAERAKAAALLGEEYKPAVPGVGAAWSHNFLNQKPWHPLNFRNQMRVFEAQEKAEKEAKARAEGKAEFDAEQEYLKTLSYLSPEEQKRYTERQGVSFMYQKPPGYDAAMSKAAEQNQATEGQAAGSEAGPSQQPEGQPAQQQASRRQPRQDLPKNYVANMLGAIGALQKHEKYEVRHVSGGGQQSPPRGGMDPNAANQQLLVSEDEDNELPASAAAGSAADELRKDEEKRKKRKKLEEAEAFLKEAGVELPVEMTHKKSKDKDKHKKKKSKKDKKERKSKERQ